MKIGLIGFNIGAIGGDQMIEAARLAEQGGVESIWTFEHTMVPLEYESKYPYTADGKMAVAPETVMVDPLISLTAVAANTSTLRLGTGVNILPQTNPLTLAKQAASLDFISAGRLMLGLGIGWLAEEYTAMGVPFERRGHRHDDYIQAMRKVWSGKVVEHQSEYLNWSGFKSYPVPIQDPLPIIVGGSKGKAFERIARYAQGWYAPTASVEEIANMMPLLQAACESHGRDVSSIEISTMWVPQMQPDMVESYADAGVDRLIVPLAALAASGSSLEDQIKRFADEVMPRVSGLS